DKIQTGEITAARRTALDEWARSFARKILQSKPDHRCHQEAVLLAATLNDPGAVEQARKLFSSARQPEDVRLKALAALIAAGDRKVLEDVAQMLSDLDAISFLGSVLAALGRSEDPRVADVVLARFGQLKPAVQAQAVELLIQRVGWSRQLLRAV